MSQIIIIRFLNIDLSLQNWVSVGFIFESIILQRTLCFPFKTKLCFYAVTSTCSAVLHTFMNLLRCMFLWKTLQSSWLMLRADDSVIRSAAQTANRTLNQDFECANTETCKHTQTPWPCDSVCTSDFLTSSSLYQDRLSAVRTNQYSLAPPFMMPMLLMVSQPFLITWETDGYSRHTERKWAETQPAFAHFTKLTSTSINLYICRHLPHTYVGLPTQQKWMS